MNLNKKIHEIINKEANDLLVEMRDNLVKSGKGDSNLSKSLNTEITGNNMFLSGNDYLEFVDKGVSGKNSPQFKGKKKTVFKSEGGFKFGTGSHKGKNWEGKIDAWMSRKGINGGRDKLGNKISKRSLNYLIRRSIYQHGIKSTMFASNAFAAFRNELYNRLSKIDFTELIKTE